MDLRDYVKKLDGESESFTYGEKLAQRISHCIGETEEEILKLHEWSTKLYGGNKVKFTKDDREYLIKLVVEMKFPVIISAPIIKYLKNG